MQETSREKLLNARRVAEGLPPVESIPSVASVTPLMFPVGAFSTSAPQLLRLDDTLLDVLPELDEPEPLPRPPATRRVIFAGEHRDAAGEFGIASIAAECLAGQLRFINELRCWMHYEGDGLWHRITESEAARLVVEAAERELLTRIEAAGDLDAKKANAKLLATLFQSRTVRGVLFFLAGFEGIATPLENFDAELWLLPVENGVLDLKTGRLLAHSPEFLFTKAARARFEPDAEAPRWEKFLSEVFAGDDELQAFVQRLAGYAVTGDTSEQIFAFLYGTGANGKTTFLAVLRHVLGDFASNASFATFERAHETGSHADGLMSLEGARLVTASESRSVTELADDVLKIIAGSDPLTGSRKYERTRTFLPTFKVFLSANNKPKVRDVTDGFWRKVLLLPFVVSFKGREEKNLVDQLLEERAGILNWMLEGCLRWQAEGLKPPAVCIEAVNTWRADNDPLADFLANCRVGAGLEVKASELYEAYERFCAVNGTKPVGTRTFAQLVEAHGFGRERHKKGVNYTGIGLGV